MILLITPSSRAEECASAVQDAVHHAVQTCKTLEQGSILLRDNEYLAVILDQLALEVEPDEGDVLHAHLGSAIPVYVNFAINGIRRVLSEIQAALRRRAADERVARQSAQETLRNELKQTITAMMLSCDLLATSSELPPTAQERLRGVQQLASYLQLQLGAAS